MMNDEKTVDRNDLITVQLSTGEVYQIKRKYLKDCNAKINTAKDKRFFGKKAKSFTSVLELIKSKYDKFMKTVEEKLTTAGDRFQESLKKNDINAFSSLSPEEMDEELERLEDKLQREIKNVKSTLRTTTNVLQERSVKLEARLGELEREIQNSKADDPNTEKLHDEMDDTLAESNILNDRLERLENVDFSRSFEEGMDGLANLNEVDLELVNMKKLQSLYQEFMDKRQISALRDSMMEQPAPINEDLQARLNEYKEAQAETKEETVEPVEPTVEPVSTVEPTEPTVEPEVVAGPQYDPEYYQNNSVLEPVSEEIEEELTPITPTNIEEEMESTLSEEVNNMMNETVAVPEETEIVEEEPVEEVTTPVVEPKAEETQVEETVTEEPQAEEVEEKVEEPKEETVAPVEETVEEPKEEQVQETAVPAEVKEEAKVEKVSDSQSTNTFEVKDFFATPDGNKLVGDFKGLINGFAREVVSNYTNVITSSYKYYEDNISRINAEYDKVADQNQDLENNLKLSEAKNDELSQRVTSLERLMKNDYTPNVQVAAMKNDLESALSSKETMLRLEQAKSSGLTDKLGQATKQNRDLARQITTLNSAIQEDYVPKNKYEEQVKSNQNLRSELDEIKEQLAAISQIVRTTSVLGQAMNAEELSTPSKRR